MPNQLTVQRQLEQFKFITGTNAGYDLNEVSDWIMGYYIDCMDRHADDMDTIHPWGLNEWVIPSRSMIISQAWGNFELEYVEYIKNGNDCGKYHEAQSYLEDGLDDEDIAIMWREMKDFCGTHQTAEGTLVTHTDKEVEYNLIDDMMLGLRMFNITYFTDTNDNYIVVNPDLRMKNWVNPPLVEVW